MVDIMMTNKEMNEAIKKELKKAGYNTKDFSVSVKDAGYETSIRIKIKSPEVNKKEIEKILNHWKVVDYDERTMEILSGGNTFLFIEYLDGIFEEVSREFVADAMGAMESQDETTKIFDGLYLINWEHKGQLTLRQQDENGTCSKNIFNFQKLCELIYKFAKFGTIAA